MIKSKEMLDLISNTLDINKAQDIKIIDLNGRVLSDWTTTSMVEQVNISDFSPGVYLVEVSQGGVKTIIRLAVD